MKRLLLVVIVLAAVLAAPARTPLAETVVVRPFEAERHTVALTPLDTRVLAEQRRRGIEPAKPCSDVVFLRRVHLDLIGTLPTLGETRAFLRASRAAPQGDPPVGHRARLVDALMVREEFADYWSLRWCDALRVKAEFPINLWPNAVQAYQRWVRTAVRDGMPYDRFARELLTSSGSNFRVPPVNFYRAVQGRDPAALSAAAALTFMGARVETWDEKHRAGLAGLFTHVASKKTAEWKEEIIFHDPAPREPFEALLPDGTSVRVGPRDDPRKVFADWLIREENPWFARAVVNRVWAWLLGRGVIHEADDIRDDNPAAIPGLLEYLAEELVLADWDLRHVIRLIVGSRTYQQSPVPQSDDPDAAAVFASYPVRRLDAEVLIDALSWIGGKGESYASAIPEPFTFVPPDHRTIALADGSITSPFLQLFGRPARDTGRLSERDDAPTDAQRLYLLNATDVRRRIERSPILRAVVRAAGRDDAKLIRGMYATLLSRPPEIAERKAAMSYLTDGARPRREGAADLAWALINSKEFQFRH